MLKGNEPDIENIELTVESYECCGGQEHFIAFEDIEKDILIGFLRLRFPARPHREELSGAALVRELHIYGSTVAVGKEAGMNDWQHRGYGRELITHAEELARDAGYNKLAIISGIGVRGYYKKVGYELEKAYMVKSLL
jgi:elongator complex protein 3